MFAFGLRLRSKTRCFKTRVLGRRLPNGKPQERLRFRDLRSKTLAFKKSIAIIFGDLKTSLGARACVQVARIQKTRRFAFAFLNPLGSGVRGRGCILASSLELSMFIVLFISLPIIVCFCRVDGEEHERGAA